MIWTAGRHFAVEIEQALSSSEAFQVKVLFPGQETAWLEVVRVGTDDMLYCKMGDTVHYMLDLSKALGILISEM